MRRTALAIGLCVTMASLCCGGCGGVRPSPEETSTGMEDPKNDDTEDSDFWDTEDPDFHLTISTPVWVSGSGKRDVFTSYDELHFIQQSDLGQHYVAPEGKFGLAFTIIEVGDDSITIETDEAMWQIGEHQDVLNATGNQHRFQVECAHTCRLQVPTTDGRTYELSLERDMASLLRSDAAINGIY